MGRATRRSLRRCRRPSAVGMQTLRSARAGWRADDARGVGEAAAAREREKAARRSGHRSRVAPRWRAVRALRGRRDGDRSRRAEGAGRRRRDNEPGRVVPRVQREQEAPRAQRPHAAPAARARAREATVAMSLLPTGRPTVAGTYCPCGNQRRASRRCCRACERYFWRRQGELHHVVTTPPTCARVRFAFSREACPAITSATVALAVRLNRAMSC